MSPPPSPPPSPAPRAPHARRARRVAEIWGWSDSRLLASAPHHPAGHSTPAGRRWTAARLCLPHGARLAPNLPGQALNRRRCWRRFRVSVLHSLPDPNHQGVSSPGAFPSAAPDSKRRRACMPRCIQQCCRPLLPKQCTRPAHPVCHRLLLNGRRSRCPSGRRKVEPRPKGNSRATSSVMARPHDSRPVEHRVRRRHRPCG